MMMSLSNPMHAVLFLLSIFSFKLSNSFVCPEIEKHSLLSFKQSLNDPGNLLSSWDGKVDCCKWKGVVCSNSTGHVHQLHLQPNFLRNSTAHVHQLHLQPNFLRNSTAHVHQLPLQPFFLQPLSGKISPSLLNLKHLTYLDLSQNQFSGKISPSLLNLKHLTYLDLSQNNFAGETIPSFMGSFRYLEYLDLSCGGFQGSIPHNIGNLSNLHTLRLGGYGFLCMYLYADGSLHVDRLDWLLGLSKLKYLSMNGVSLSRATKWAEVINSLPSLQEINLIACSLDFWQPPNKVNLSTSLSLINLDANNYLYESFPFPQWVFQLNNLISLGLSGNSFVGQIPSVSNATKLQQIDLTSNSLNSSIPDWIYFCKDLEFVRFGSNAFSGEISHAIGNLTSLIYLDMSRNQLSGKLPREILKLCRIQSLDLSSNELQGELPNSFGDMSECFLESLAELRLSSNQLSGHLTFGESKILQLLDLSSNSLSGEIPVSLGSLLYLEELFLDSNYFTGNLPESLGQLFNLRSLFIENNKLEGIVTESHFTNLSKLDTFSASGNHLILNVGSNWVPPFQLRNLGLGSWNLGVGSQIPSWIQMHKSINQLDVSNTGISGTINGWFFGITFLNVSNNNLHGTIPRIFRSNRWDAQYMILSSNKFSGSLPRIGNNVVDLDLSHNLFSGGISDRLCDTTYETYALHLLHLEGNQLSGELPDCLMKWPFLAYLELGNNKMFGPIPNSIGSLIWLQSLSLYGNKFSGQIPFSMRNCTNLLKLDLSENNLDGNLPTWMGTSLLNLKILNLRSNKLGGEISSELCHLQSIQILDLSNNRISGMIPRCVCNLKAMATKKVLNLDYVNNSSTGMYSPPTSLEGPFTESASIVTKGVELEYSTTLSLVTNIDLSMNNLSGEIPKELTSLVDLISLNLSGNHFTGLIPVSIGDMRQLESLDLSRNCLSGQIPNGFTLLSSLSHLNLSFNKLTGRIPESTQLQTLEASSFIGNNLCGPPLSNCSGNGDDGKEGNEGDKKSEIEWLYVFLSLGYAVGFSAVCTALVLKKSWRVSYFRWLECTWDKLYVYIYVGWARLRKSTTSSSPS